MQTGVDDMKASSVLGGLFVVLAAFEIVGVAILTGASVRPEVVAVAPSQSVALTVLATAWVFGLWAALVAFMVYVIAWVAEGMAAEPEFSATPVQTHREERPREAVQRHEPSKLVGAS